MNPASLAAIGLIELSAAAAMIAAGVWAATAARPALKRALGLVFAHLGAAHLVLALDPAAGGLAAGVVIVGAAWGAVGAAIAVRLKETSGSSEQDEVDALEDARRARLERE